MILICYFGKPIIKCIISVFIPNVIIINFHKYNSRLVCNFIELYFPFENVTVPSAKNLDQEGKIIFRVLVVQLRNDYNLDSCSSSPMQYKFTKVKIILFLILIPIFGQAPTYDIQFAFSLITVLLPHVIIFDFHKYNFDFVCSFIDFYRPFEGRKVPSVKYLLDHDGKIILKILVATVKNVNNINSLIYSLMQPKSAKKLILFVSLIIILARVPTYEMQFYLNFGSVWSTHNINIQEVAKPSILHFVIFNKAKMIHYKILLTHFYFNKSFCILSYRKLVKNILELLISERLFRWYTWSMEQTMISRELVEIFFNPMFNAQWFTGYLCIWSNLVHSEHLYFILSICPSFLSELFPVEILLRNFYAFDFFSFTSWFNCVGNYLVSTVLRNVLPQSRNKFSKFYGIRTERMLRESQLWTDIYILSSNFTNFNTIIDGKNSGQLLIYEPPDIVSATCSTAIYGICCLMLHVVILCKKSLDGFVSTLILSTLKRILFFAYTHPRLLNSIYVSLLYLYRSSYSRTYIVANSNSSYSFCDPHNYTSAYSLVGLLYSFCIKSISRSAIQISVCIAALPSTKVIKINLIGYIIRNNVYNYYDKQKHLELDSIVYIIFISTKALQPLIISKPMVKQKISICKIEKIRNFIVCFLHFLGLCPLSTSLFTVGFSFCYDREITFFLLMMVISNSFPVYTKIKLLILKMYSCISYYFFGEGDTISKLNDR